jgi:hypothetical protein
MPLHVCTCSAYPARKGVVRLIPVLEAARRLPLITADVCTSFYSLITPDWTSLSCLRCLLTFLDGGGLVQFAQNVGRPLVLVVSAVRVHLISLESGPARSPSPGPGASRRRRQKVGQKA